ncbi:hypothetical protein AMECASPLE_019896 [Ameca splendens]|uniref:Uncharacterized protein n=1 Tax=Ameca splendens TaxID=208324 RepID=A0ABV1ACR5_9TELE
MIVLTLVSSLCPHTVTLKCTFGWCVQPNFCLPKLTCFQLVSIVTLCRWAQNHQSDGCLGSLHGQALQCSHVHSPVELHNPVITLPLPPVLSVFSLSPFSHFFMLTFPASQSVIPFTQNGDFHFSNVP